jgi:hypothetical protein
MVTRIAYSAVAGTLFAFAAFVTYYFVSSRDSATLGGRPLALAAAAFATGIIASIIGTTYGHSDTFLRRTVAWTPLVFLIGLFRIEVAHVGRDLLVNFLVALLTAAFFSGAAAAIDRLGRSKPGAAA